MAGRAEVPGAPIGDDPGQPAVAPQASGLTVINGGGHAEESDHATTPPVLEILTRPSGRHKATIRVAAVVALSLGALALVLFPLRGSHAPKRSDNGRYRPTNFRRWRGIGLGSGARSQAGNSSISRGRYYWNKRTPDDLNKALDYFMQAVVHDPNYAQAYVGLADCYNLMREYTLMPSSEAYPRALAAAKEAVELDSESSRSARFTGLRVILRNVGSGDGRAGISPRH